MNPSSQNNNGMYSGSYTPVGQEKSGLKKLLIIAACVFVVICIIALVVSYSRPQSQQSKYIQSATAAARKQTPNAEVTNVRVAGGFALAVVSDPTADGQASAGNTTVFRVNKDGSMNQLASGSYFSPLDLLELGVPLATQAKLTGSNTAQVKQELAGGCGYNGGNAPGYSGFDGSFNPGGWQIDSATLIGLEKAVTDNINNNNAGAPVVCVNATQKNSNATTSLKTYVSTFTLQVQFVTADGKLTNHTLTFATGPNYYRNYTLDGQEIQKS